MLLQVNGLTLETAEKILLDDVDFTIGRGEIFALVGESGSGKSLTSLAIMRLLPQAVTVTGGEVVLDEVSLFALTESQMQKVRGKRIAMIFQEPMSALNPVMTIGEQVAEALRLHFDLKESEVRARVIALFEEVALPDAAARYGWYPHQLSGGQKQRVMIAMALACEPELLIADEPTTALDVTVQAQVLDLLKTIRQKRRLSILFITHDLAVVAQVADRIAVMKEGSIVETADAARFFAAPSHPYTQKLLRDVQGTAPKRREPKYEPLLEIEGLKVHFSRKKGLLGRKIGSVKAVDGVSLQIGRGSTLALVGESGSGKSTLAQAILALVPVTKGHIRYRGRDITYLSEKERKPYRQKIQVVFQDPFSALDPRMRIGEIIKEGMESLGTDPRNKVAQRAYIETILQTVELDAAYIDRYPHELSGGQRQRVGIARALAVEPELIICDEPTSALDVSVRAQILVLLKRLQQETGISYLFITHDLSIVPAIADSVAVMQAGRIVEIGKTQSVLFSPEHPYTRTLLAAVPKLPTFHIKEKP
jgi:peptide/nickel transport system ATP-binding protein